MARQAIKNVHRLIQAKTKKVPTPKSFVTDLTSCIERLDAQEARKPSRSYKPSSMVCERNMYFQIVGAEQDGERSPSCLVGICESGTDRHERIQRAVSKMREMGYDCDYLDVGQYIQENKIPDIEVVKKDGFETKLRHTKLNISFKCDGLIRYKGKLYILEIKTESIHKWVMREDVAEEHKAQGTCYALALLVDEVMFVYENRDNCDKKAYLLKVTQRMKQELVLAKISLVDSCVTAGVPPKKRADVPKKTCNYCNYKTICGRSK